MRPLGGRRSMRAPPRPRRSPARPHEPRRAERARRRDARGVAPRPHGVRGRRLPTALSASSPIPSIATARRSSHPASDRPTASARRSWSASDAPSSARRAAPPPSELLLVADRLLREPEREARWFAIATLQRTLGARAGANVAAAPARRVRGRRLDHGRQPCPPVRQGHPRRAVPLGRAGAADGLAVALGAPPGRLHHRHDAVGEPQRRPRAARSRRTVAAPPRDADRRSRAGRPEGALLGIPIDGRRRPGGHDRGAPRARRTQPRSATTAIGRGSSATASRSSSPPIAERHPRAAVRHPPPSQARRPPRAPRSSPARFAGHGPRPPDA